MSATNGTASPTIRRVPDEAIDRAISAGNRVRIVFVSVDGDEGYPSYFPECFAKLRLTIRSRGCDEGEIMETVTFVCHSGSVIGFVCSKMYGRGYLPLRYV
jgi:hypothetical protein